VEAAAALVLDGGLEGGDALVEVPYELEEALQLRGHVVDAVDILLEVVGHLLCWVCVGLGAAAAAAAAAVGAYSSSDVVVSGFAADIWCCVVGWCEGVALRVDGVAVVGGACLDAALGQPIHTTPGTRGAAPRTTTTNATTLLRRAPLLSRALAADVNERVTAVLSRFSLEAALRGLLFGLQRRRRREEGVLVDTVQ